MKNDSRNKFLLCFRPVVDMDLVLETEGGIESSREKQILKCVAADKYSASENDQCSQISKNSMVIRHPSRRTFSKVIKAVLFETMLAKRVDDRKKLSQDSFQSSSRSSSRQRSMDSGHEKTVNRDNSVDSLNSLSSIGSPSSSSSSLSRLTSTLLSELKRQNQSNNNRLVKRSKKDYMGSSCLNYAIILLLLSLSFTILWGRLCAILLTSIWLYSVPRQTGSNPDDEEVRKLSKRDSPEITGGSY